MTRNVIFVYFKIVPFQLFINFKMKKILSYYERTVNLGIRIGFRAVKMAQCLLGQHENLSSNARRYSKHSDMFSPQYHGSRNKQNTRACWPVRPVSGRVSKSK